MAETQNEHTRPQRLLWVLVDGDVSQETCFIASGQHSGFCPATNMVEVIGQTCFEEREGAVAYARRYLSEKITRLAARRAALDPAPAKRMLWVVVDGQVSHQTCFGSSDPTNTISWFCPATRETEVLGKTCFEERAEAVAYAKINLAQTIAHLQDRLTALE